MLPVEPVGSIVIASQTLTDDGADRATAGKVGLRGPANCAVEALEKAYWHGGLLHAAFIVLLLRVTGSPIAMLLLTRVATI